MIEDLDKRIAYDYAKDARQEMRSSRMIILAMAVVIALMVVGIVVICISNQLAMERMAKHNSETLAEFMSQYDYEATIDVSTTENMFDAGNVHITR